MATKEKKYLSKVLDHLVSETRIESNKIYTPFLLHSPSSPALYSISISYPSFSRHCRNVYGLTKEEVKYVWEQYRQIIKDKIKNG